MRGIGTSIGAELPVGTDQALFGHLLRNLFYLDFVWFSAKFDRAQRFADLAEINTPWALAFTRETRGAAPRRIRIENLLEPKLQIAHDLVGK